MEEKWENGGRDWLENYLNWHHSIQYLEHMLGVR